ncbi:MAG: hypothetical protein ACRYGF_06115 [Janthinobacterium lividum]
MRKLTSIEARYWVDSFPADLALGACVGLLVAAATAYLVDHFALQYYAGHRVLDPGQHGIAALFLSLLLALFAFVGTTAAVLVVRLFLRMYRDPL